jgi:hypothetical protein
MEAPMRSALRGSIVGASPGYELVPYAHDCRAPTGSPDDCPAHAELRPRGARRLSSLLVSGRTADLVRSLERPRPVADIVDGHVSPRDELALVRLVVDGILAVDVGGRALTGPAAFRHLLEDAGRAPSAGRVAALTRRALEYGAALLPARDALLADRLYRYNTVPASGRWVRRAGTLRTGDSWLGLDAIRVRRSPNSAMWTRGSPERDGPWVHWTRADDGERHRGTPMYKLYVSPVADELPETLRVTAERVLRSSAVAMKVGRGLYGILRPDKLVVYFGRREAMLEVAGSLARELSGARAQGVPFSAPLSAGDDLLSWGIDLPAVQSGLRSESWRRYVVDRLARAMVVSHDAAGAAAITPVEFALARLALDGIDPGSFAPNDPGDWSAAVA